MSTTILSARSDNDKLPEVVRRFAELVHGQHGQPSLLLPSEHLQAVAEVLGGYAISSPIPNLSGNQPFQLDSPLTFFYGIASPTAREDAHRHPHQDEWYHPEGQMEVEAWWNSHHIEFVAPPGSVVIIPRGAWHRVRTLNGITHVVKSPQLSGEIAKVVYRGR